MIDLVRPNSPELWAAATRLVEEYASSLDVDLDFQNFDEEIANLPAEYGRWDTRRRFSTLPSMERAQALYRSLDFTPTESYRFNPVRGATFLKLDL
jgi:hypothetical protein